MKLKLIKKESVAKDTISFWFRPESKLRYIAGQYIELSLPHANPDSRMARRWFTLSSSPTEELLAITTKFKPDSSSFKKALHNLPLGSSVQAQMPMGDFVLPKDTSRPLVFVAGGIGVTPYRSMLKFLSDSAEKRDVTVIYVVKDAEEIAFEDILQKSANKVVKHFGRLNAQDLLQYTGHINDEVVYISGPEKMVETLYEDMIKNGVPRLQLRTDFFHNYY